MKGKIRKSFITFINQLKLFPIEFKLEYLEELENKRYFEAMKYIVSISIGQYQKLKSNNQIEIDSDMIFASVDYSSELGLLLDSEDSIMGIFNKN